MTTHDADALAADDEAGYALALGLKQALIEECPQPDASVILHAACWLLADVITQAARRVPSAPPERTVPFVMVKLWSAIDRLQRANAEADDLLAVRH